MKKKYLYTLITSSFLTITPINAHAFDLGQFFKDLLSGLTYAGSRSNSADTIEEEDNESNDKTTGNNKENKYVEPIIYPNMKVATNCFNHYIWGAPKINDDTDKDMVYLCKEFYSVGYDLKSKKPLWVSQQLKKEDLKLNGTLNAYFYDYDPQIPRKFQDKEANVNRIRLAPTEMMLSSEEGRKQSFYYTNTIKAPKNALLDSIDIWTNQLLKQRAILTTMSGPIFLNKNSNDPTHFYKIIVDTQVNEAIAFIVPNKPIVLSGQNGVGYNCSDKGKQGCNLFDFSTNIAEVQRVTGITFLPSIADNSVLKLKVSDEFINPTRHRPGYN